MSKKALIDQSLESMNMKLEKVSALVRELESVRAEKYGELSKQLVTASAATARLSDAADQLRGILSNPTARGQWGERLAEDVLRAAGLVEGSTTASRCQWLRLPSGLHLQVAERTHSNMDVKFPLDNYLRSFESTSDSRPQARAPTSSSATCRRTSSRCTSAATLMWPNGRWTTRSSSCRMSACSASSMSAMRPPSMDALKNGVVICSPFTLYAVLVVVRQAMDNFTFAQTTSEVLELHGEFNREWKKFKGTFDGIKESIDELQESFETLASTRRRKLDGVLDKIDQLRGPERGTAGGASAGRECAAARDARRMYASCNRTRRLSRGLPMSRSKNSHRPHPPRSTAPKPNPP